MTIVKELKLRIKKSLTNGKKKVSLIKLVNKEEEVIVARQSLISMHQQYLD